ncbi:hypothetical protein MAPG_04753 [Magnaporthiopsis poae ATCC 64411]|uniref:Heterokaryon incompatibility domain-containing protein n=1 Tax=Magnaporthiopsis poae (strain ATCC 64411 / 73-15) TaxID=644358 RepID=A0A0C4DXJ9_MAGP6|nr:hypothetical protein MAPG_04753 [Magnaporthiopsis poae ATCC 64411]
MLSTKDGKNESLNQLSQQKGASVISQLVDIGAERNQERHRKPRTFVTQLCCFRPEGTPEAATLRRISINAFQNHQYVALSYTWDPSKYEDDRNGGFHVQDWDSASFTPSPVRNCVFNRVLHYMRHHDVGLLWIDRHSIRQDASPGGLDSGPPCSTNHIVSKEDALGAMDLVYRLSEHPVALLGRPINDALKLRRLHRVLSGDLVDGQNGSNGSAPRLSREASISDASMALLLLHEITRDHWWTRAWTFQENYRGGMAMHLLISHPASLEELKLQLDAERGGAVLGEIPGELCVESVTFSKQATLLCQALRGVAGYLAVANQVRQIEDVERAAGRYQLLLSKSSPMTPRVLADVESRKQAEAWDRLAIVANCCRYPIRLDRVALRRQDHSLSLSLLAMCLLNGEILDNGDDNDDAAVSVGGLTASGCLEKLIFKRFQAPENERRRLTFNMGCRLNYVELTASGVAARGHLWELGPTIDTADFPWSLPFIRDPDGFMELEDRKRLLQLVLQLQHSGHCELANHLDEWLKRDSRGFRAADVPQTFTEVHLLTMAEELAAAIRARRNLRLGRIWGQRLPSSAIFIMPDRGSQNCDAHGNPRMQPSFVFTSIRQGDDDSPAIIAHDTDCYASLGVDIEGFQAGSGVPQLRIRSWLFGMCFFTGCPRVSVVFPWPKALQNNARG